MSYVDDFNLDDYETIDELSEVRADIQMEISALNGYLRGIGEKILALEDAAEDVKEVR